MNKLRLKWKIKRKTWWRDKTATERGDFYLRLSIFACALVLGLIIGAAFFFTSPLIALIGVPTILLVLLFVAALGG